MKVTATEKAEAIARLKELAPAGSTIYGIVRHVSSSGMSRRISFYSIQDNKPVFLDGWLSKVTGYKRHPKEGLVVGGCGMNMVMHVVTTAAHEVFGTERSWSYDSL